MKTRYIHNKGCDVISKADIAPLYIIIINIISYYYCILWVQVYGTTV